MINKILKTVHKVLNTQEHQKTDGKERSPEWPKIRKAHLEKESKCACCGSTEKLQVHHKVPFHLDPKLELDHNNLITLCEGGNKNINCHIVVGHGFSFKDFNPKVEETAAYFYKLKTEIQDKK